MVPCRAESEGVNAPRRQQGLPESSSSYSQSLLGSGFALAWSISCCDNRLLEDLLIGYYICLGDPHVLADSATGLPFDTL